MTKRVPFQNGPMPLNPRRTNIGVDANALDLDGSARDDLVRRFCAMSDAQELIVVVAAGVRNEVQNPKTPSNVQVAVLPQIFNLRPGLTSGQQEERRRLARILQGNADPSTHAADASHLSEAVETGCGYFITHDNRILKKRSELRPVIPPTLQIVSLAEFFQIVDDYDEGHDELV
ncbi:MAG TPA: type II toxin-antitoxin system VapC family toxin [Bradyrhizobium sp.]|nr:type II toxin-antitoxin system VapC family toxin [Bradyrhizobium sp.]